MSRYLILKILNHNVVLVKDEQNQEWLLFGRGIGFQQQVGTEISSAKIENKYALVDSDRLAQYQELISTSHESASVMSEWIISEMSKCFGSNYNTYIHISLLDHLNFLLKRLKGNLVINNLFESELKFIYPKEYEFSLQMVDKIRKQLGIDLPISEAGMISLHIHSALHHEKVSNTALIMNVVSSTVTYLENTYGKVTDEVLKNRLIIHLKFAVKRSLDKVKLQNDLIDVVKLKFSKSYAVASEIGLRVDDEFYIHLDESEIVYLAIHLQNIFHFEGEK